MLIRGCVHGLAILIREQSEHLCRKSSAEPLACRSLSEMYCYKQLTVLFVGVAGPRATSTCNGRREDLCGTTCTRDPRTISETDAGLWQHGPHEIGLYDATTMLSQPKAQPDTYVPEHAS